MHESANMTTVSEPSEDTRKNVLSVVIPALNEEESIRDIVLRVQAAAEGLRRVGIQHTEILVVDDGSRDRTCQIVGTLPGVSVVRHPQTRGYGAAIKTGFTHARGEWLAFLDADGTYPPEQLPTLCQAAIEHHADIVVGSRRSGALSQMPLVRRLGNFIWSSLVTCIGNRRCVDPASGMRVIRRSVLPSIYPLPDGLNFTPVMSTRAVHEDLEVLEIPISYFERAGRSKLSVVHDGLRFLKTILWTALEYNPAKILGIAGGVFVCSAVMMGLALVLLRARGVTVLGAWGAFGVFTMLVLAVGGMSVYSFGISFGFLVSLFHRRPVRRLLFRGFFATGIERQLGWVGGSSIGLGIVLALTSMIAGNGAWNLERIWLWLLVSALFVLVGTQVVISWILARVLEKLAQRDAVVRRELPVDIECTTAERVVETSVVGPISPSQSPV